MSEKLSCAHCGQHLLTYEPREVKYGNPIRTCPNCGREYLDPRVREMAISGVPGKEFSKAGMLLCVAVGAVIALYGWYKFGQAVRLPAEIRAGCYIALGAVVMLGGIVELIRVLTGTKQKKYDFLMEESQQRVSNESYVAKLKFLGYPFPEEEQAGNDQSS